MNNLQRVFSEQAEKKAFDPAHRQTLRFNIGKYETAVKKGVLQYSHIENARRYAARQKEHCINNLEHHLITFESRFTARGGRVIWAHDAREAVTAIVKILKSHGVRNVVKSKSMITEELELNTVLQGNGISVLETDLGEYIVQLDNDRPYHIITPVMHKSKKDIAELFHAKFGLNPESTAEEITAFVRAKLREKFMQADAGITGANFLIADTGSVLLTENEGNGVMSVSWPRLHIAIAGIEKVIPSIRDLQVYLPLLATMGTGQKVTVYNSIISGPAKSKEPDGPAEMFVVLLDNGRTNLLAKPEQRSALRCIKCGACLNYCPVYKNIGGHAYGTTYSGPIGSIITPHLKGMEYKHLSFASSLCGKCSEVCPVKIPIHKILLLNRRDAVKEGFRTAQEKRVMTGYKMVMSRRRLLNRFSPGVKNLGLNLFFKKSWGSRRTLPHFDGPSFNQEYQKAKVKRLK
ncbi:MAG TPA: lactate utilization protein B [Bacteroidales bacterium]|nr:lactate utilization protein B [Bacteroidales bacterium]HRZ48261.1 lactate utilization protein B [Bacteroidales bacterium]